MNIDDKLLNPPRERFANLKMSDKHINLVIKRVLYKLWKHNRPNYIGELSLETKVSVNRTMQIVDYLVEQNVVCYLTNLEKKNNHIDNICIVVRPLIDFTKFDFDW